MTDSINAVPAVTGPTQAPITTPTSGLAVGSLICGIFGFFTCGLTALPAVILGVIAMTKTADGQRAGHGQAWAGVILGGVIIAVWVLLWVLGVVGSFGEEV